MSTIDRAFRRMAASRPASKDRKCDGCGRPIAMAERGWRNTPIVVTEEEVSFMRGEDVVRFYHPGCEPEEARRLLP